MSEIAPEGGGLRAGRGRKDPALKAQLDSAPARRRRAAPVAVEPEEPEYVPEAPMEPDDGMMLDPGEGNPDEMPLLFEGDIVMFRLSKTPTLPDGQEMWAAMGAQTRVQPEEDPQDTADRLRQFVVDELEYATDQAIEAHMEAERRRAAERREPRPRSRRSAE